MITTMITVRTMPVITAFRKLVRMMDMEGSPTGSGARGRGYAILWQESKKIRLGRNISEKFAL